MVTLSIPFSKDELASLDEEVFSFGKTRVEVVRELVHNFNKEKQEAKILAGIREAERGRNGSWL